MMGAIFVVIRTRGEEEESDDGTATRHNRKKTHKWQRRRNDHDAENTTTTDPPGSGRVELRIATWNVNGLGSGERRETLLAAAAKLGYDVTLLQETHIHNERQWAAAQRLWQCWGPSLWSTCPARGAVTAAGAAAGKSSVAEGVAVLLRRDDPTWRVAHTIDVWPGHLLIVNLEFCPGKREGFSSGKQEQMPAWLMAAKQVEEEKERAAPAKRRQGDEDARQQQRRRQEEEATHFYVIYA